MNKTNHSAPQQNLEDIPASNPEDSPINVKGNFSAVEYRFNPIFQLYCISASYKFFYTVNASYNLDIDHYVVASLITFELEKLIPFMAK